MQPINKLFSCKRQQQKLDKKTLIHNQCTILIRYCSKNNNPWQTEMSKPTAVIAVKLKARLCYIIHLLNSLLMLKFIWLLKNSFIY